MTSQLAAPVLTSYRIWWWWGRHRQLDSLSTFPSANKIITQDNTTLGTILTSLPGAWVVDMSLPRFLLLEMESVPQLRPLLQYLLHTAPCYMYQLKALTRIRQHPLVHYGWGDQHSSNECWSSMDAGNFSFQWSWVDCTGRVYCSWGGFTCIPCFVAHACNFYPCWGHFAREYVHLCQVICPFMLVKGHDHEFQPWDRAHEQKS